MHAHVNYNKSILRYELRSVEMCNVVRNIQLNPDSKPFTIEHVPFTVCALFDGRDTTSRFTSLNGNLKGSREIREELRHATFFANGLSIVCLVCVVKRKNCYGSAVTLSKHGSWLRRIKTTTREW